MRMRFLTMAAVFAAGLASGVAAQTVDRLDRLSLRHDLLGWEAVGRVDLGGQSFCTGALIAPDLVLTAAHCVLSVDGTRRDPSRMMFRAGLVDGNSVADRGVARIVAHGKYLDGQGGRDVHYDVALLQLDAAISPSAASYFAVGTKVGREVSVASYAEGRNLALSRQRACSVVREFQGLYAFDCNVWFGSSGAPVFDLSSGVPRIVSIISSGRSEENGVLSFGMELPRVLADLKSALRSGQGVWPEAAPVAARRIGAGAATTRDGGSIRFLRP